MPSTKALAFLGFCAAFAVIFASAISLLLCIVVYVDPKRLNSQPFFRFLTTFGFRVTMVCMFAIGVMLLAVSLPVLWR